jgi:glycerol-3-phosphate dehydrogenase
MLAAKFLSPNAPVLSVSKGMEIESFSLMTDVLTETLGATRPLAFLSGPSFAREIAEGYAD